MRDIFQLGEVAELTELPKHTVKQWSVGKPYTIRPSVRVAPDQGIANLYSTSDLLRFAVAAQLTRDGFISRMIKRALDKIEPGMQTLMLISGRAYAWNLTAHDAIARMELELNERLSVYALAVGRLRDDLNQKIAARTK